jgi:hypothetical protein
MHFAVLDAEYAARCRGHGDRPRPRDDFGDPIEGAWADGARDWPTEAQGTRFHEATAFDADAASA